MDKIDYLTLLSLPRPGEQFADIVHEADQIHFIGGPDLGCLGDFFAKHADTN